MSSGVRVVERPRPQSRQVERVAPRLLVMISVGAVRIIPVATNDREGAVCLDLATDLEEELANLHDAVARLNR